MVEQRLNGKNLLCSYELRPGLNKIGRNPTNDLRISDASVSSFHCEIEVSGEETVVRDLCSTNGTFIEGLRIEEGKIDLGQHLRLGQIELVLESGPIRIGIPEAPMEEEARQQFMPDGAAACLNHVDLHAEFRCTKCQHAFCEDCVRIVSFQGRRQFFCQECSGGVCEPLYQESHVEVRAAVLKKKKSFLGRLTQTIRLRLGG